MKNAIVLDGRGGVILAEAVSPSNVRPIITHNHDFWSSRIFDFDIHYFLDPMEEEATEADLCDPWTKKTVNMRGVRLYVNSVSGATEASDTGDGTAGKPFSCLNSALRFLKRYLHDLRTEIQFRAVTTGCSCSDRNFGVQIYLSGVVDYSITDFGFSYIPALCIIGNGQTEIHTELYNLWNFAYYKVFFGCIIKIKNLSYWPPYSSLYENCEIHLFGWADGFGGVCSQCAIHLEVDPLGEDEPWFYFGYMDGSTIYANSMTYDEEGLPTAIAVEIYSGDYTIEGTYKDYVDLYKRCEYEPQ